MLLWLLACTPQTLSDTEPDPVEVVDEADVVVIGAGPAGLAAAWAAQEAGRDVRVFDARSEAGGAGAWIRYYWAVGTEYQALAGLDDSAEQARADWAAVTDGDGDDPVVATFIEESAGVLDWLVDDLGATVLDLTEGAATDEPPRLHVLADAEEAPVHALVAALADVTVLDTWVTGAEPEDGWLLETSLGTVRAGSVVVASGGFARDLARATAHHPELAERDVLFDHAPHVDGATHGLFGGDEQNHGALGLYVHATRDPRDGYQTEVVVLSGLARAAIVSSAGERVGDESTAGGLRFAQHGLDGQLHALWPESAFNAVSGFVPGYNPLDDEGDVLLSGPELLEEGVATRFDNLEVLMADLAIDEALVSTLSAYDAVARGEAEDAFGKDPDDFVPFGGAPVVAVPLYISTSKAFTGLHTDADGALLVDGQPLPGVYAAGEAIGMLGTDGVGMGWQGSATAVYWSGLRAGRSAAN